MERDWTHAGIQEAAYSALAKGLAASELWSLLLGIAEQRAAQRSAALVLQQWEKDRFVCPSYVDQRTLNQLDGHLLAAASAFEALELSPLAPLGSCSAIALASQNKIVSTIRGTEVVSDPTNLLALESARRLRKNGRQAVKLTTNHRCVRAQAVPKHAGFAAHFRLFCITSAGQERKDQGFLVESLSEHIQTHLGALNRLEQHGYDFPDRSLKILATPERKALGERVASGVRSLGRTSIVFETLTHNYYDGLRFMISARSLNGEHMPLIDGGAFDWLRKLTSNNKLVFVASGLGSQLAAYLYRLPG
ncbi:MAG TPA: hypothetical protein VK743_17965 [Steroidobacteraceae bacterium]|nr:hypothetical protein [Steroidobacteraceae bacterium]